MLEEHRPASKAGYSKTQETPEWFGQLPGYPSYALLNQGNTTAGRRNHGITQSIPNREIGATTSHYINLR